MEKQSGNKTSSSSFLKTDGGKTKSNAIEVPSISLPKGGGAIKGIDEKFSVNALNGTASFSIPLPVSSSRGLAPSLSLSYNSGAGNGIFGLGWNVGLSSIKRKTDKELPEYSDDSDTFLFSEAEDLVPEFKKAPGGSFLTDDKGDYIIREKDSADGLSVIRCYRPRIEGLFARIERWCDKSSGKLKWRVITKGNVITLFGWTSASRISDPEDDSRTFEWLPEFVFDDKGNCSHYIYKKEDDKGFDASLLHNRNRFAAGTIRYANLYIEKVLYGNKTPYKKFGTAFPAESDYLFSTVFDYGEYDPNAPYNKIRDWDFRPDAFSDYKAGFEIRTTRVCKRVLLFHHFSGTGEYDGLVRSLDFKYNTASESFTFLQSITSTGYIKQASGAYTQKSLPAMEYGYQAHEWNRDVKAIAAEDLVHAPSGIDEQQYQFTDLFNEGLSGILTEQSGGWYYKRNLGDGNFAQAELITPKPSFSGLGNKLQLADLDADGGKQLVNFSAEPKGYFELSDDNEWQNFKNFKGLPNINFSDENTRMLDLNGDGKPEMLISEENAFTWYSSEGRDGFSAARRTAKPFDEEKGASIVFADPKQTIFLADMSGDGMTDLVRIRNGEVCYWPNLGYGKFGAKVAMDNAPLFDHPDSFNPAYLRLADIDGSGTTDIIYLGKNKFSCWMNSSGNGFSTTAFEIDAFPEIHNRSKVTVTDLLGNGVACIVWSAAQPKDNGASVKYVDLMNSRKPHIMVSYKNNLGKEVSLEYTASTKFYLDDKAAGRPWITKLHFPVHCISKSETRDRISGYRFVSSYKYHHGYYDHPEREFRGFGMVEQADSEYFEHWIKGSASNIVGRELHQEPVVSRSWSHTGAFLDREKILGQFATEYWYEEMIRQGFPVTHHEVALPEAELVAAPGMEPTLIDALSAEEWREAFRACKGMSLRSEVFAKDAASFGSTAAARKKELTPYSVATNNCMIELLQPRGKNKHAVFVVKQSEAITYSYERDPADPRIAHNLTISLDEYGNVLESAAVVYPRLTADTSLPSEMQQEQNKTVIMYTQSEYTNDVTGDDVYCLRLPSEIKTYELKGVSKTGTLYSLKNFDEILSDTNSDTAEYHESDKALSRGKAQKRLIEHVRSTYYRSDLSGALSLHKLESPVFSFESYQLAYTPVLLAEIYGTKAGDALMAEGKYTHSEGDASWWIRSGTIQYLEGTESAADAQNRFYLPISYTDPYGSKTKVSYYGSYFLFIEATEDALGNRSRTERFNFRTLSAERMKDINDNLSEAIADELGLVKAMAVFGKGAEADDLAGINDFTDAVENSLVSSFFNVPDTADHVADSVKLAALGKQLLKHSTSRFVYDFDVYKNTGKPVVVASITREEHFKKSSDSPVQLSFEYSNGLGQVVMKKMQAEPGTAKKVSVNADDTYTVAGEDTSGLVPAQLRWIGNGKTILNNKGNAVKQYEPYFSVNHRYEDLKELVETGVTPILYYDAPGRVIRTELPDGTFSKVEFDSWKQCAYDASDTVLESSWYSNRTGRLIDALLLAEGKDPAREKEAADKAAKHGNTPSQLHLDTLGRTVLTIEHNRNITTAADEYFRTKVNLDAEGNLRSVSDARGNTVMEYKYDMLGNLVYQKSMDAGCRWLLVNILGNPLRTWDERDHEFRYFYDELHRPLYSVVTGGDGTAALNNIFERIVYAESLLLPGRTNEAALKAINILGKPLKHYDTGGMIETAEYDFKGQAIATTRRLFKKYQSVADWTDANILTDLETESFTFASETDALGRITKQTAPDGSIITPSYNEAGLLNGEAVEHKDPSLTSTYIKNIDYNEKGQRSRIIYGNDVTTDFYYDKETFRLKRLETKRKNNDPLQDWHYTFDPVGNITHIEDKNVPLVFFNNSKVTGISEYTYDALYRLVEATGRENNAALTFSSSDNWNDVSYMQRMNEGDPMSVRNYTQKYQYDAAGNMEQMKHLATGNNWTRAFTYEAASNRLSTTQIGTETYRYSHHVKHGFISKMPQLEEMEWSFKEELVKTIRQKRTDGGTPETTYYQYDGKGQRIRKITENAADKGITATRKEERIYISGYETFRRYTLDALDFERESLSLLDGGHRFVMVETVKKNTDTAPDPSDMIGARLVRYQLHNHLGSAALELDGTDDAAVISYEEYHPFGTTAYQANNAAIKASAKRYRYTGMERDEETGLEYHSARYYLPWLGRWLSTDPIGIGDGVNLYRYVGNNPVMMHDPTGTDGEVCKPDDVFEFSSPENMVCQEPIAEESAADPKDSPDVFVSPEEDSTSVGEVALSILFLPLTLTGCSSPTPKPPSTISGNYVIIAGGTSVNDPGGHDKKGSNFLDSAARRAKDIIANNPGAKVTVIMYSPDDLSYQKRAVTDKKDKFFYEDLMRDSATKNKYELVIIKKGTELTPLLNTAKDGQIKQLEYFGHSNASDFLLEYSSSVPARSTDRWGMGGSEVTGVRKEIFQPTGEVIFYGCNLGDTGGLGEDVKKRWGLETTASDIKTDYSSTVGSNWKPDGHYIKMK